MSPFRQSIRRLLSPSSLSTPSARTRRTPTIRHLHLHPFQERQLLSSLDLPVPQPLTTLAPSDVESNLEAWRSYRESRTTGGAVVVEADVVDEVPEELEWGVSDLRGTRFRPETEQELKDLLNVLSSGTATRPGNPGAMRTCDRLAYIRDHSGTAVPLTDNEKERRIRLVIQADRRPVAKEGGGLIFGPTLTLMREGPKDPSSSPPLRIPIDHTTFTQTSRGTSPTLLETISEFLSSRPAGGANGDRAGVKDSAESLRALARQLWKVFEEKEGSRFDLVLEGGGGGKYEVVDHHLEFDDFASHRQREIFSLRDIGQEDATEVGLEKLGLVYRRIAGGNIGCFGYGAGMGMATVDGLILAGGKPANFLDGGGGATAENARAGIETLMEDPNVEVIFVNIFGGITKSDLVAEGMIQAVRASSKRIPIVVRIRGNKAEEAKSLLEASDLGFKTIDDFREASKAAVDAARGG